MYPGLPNYGYGVQIGLPEALTILGIGPWAQDRKLDRKLRQEEADRANRAQMTSDMDSASKAEYYKQAGVAQQIDALKGILGTLFRPEDAATREQVLAKMYELAGIVPASGSGSGNENLSGLGAAINGIIEGNKGKRGDKKREVKETVETSAGRVQPVMAQTPGYGLPASSLGSGLPTVDNNSAGVADALTYVLRDVVGVPTGEPGTPNPVGNPAIAGALNSVFGNVGASGALNQVLQGLMLARPDKVKVPSMDRLSNTRLGTINYQPR